ncbi:MAG: hypothetical protein C0597_12675 [Marinilabiliales bacterium]|nr:MAG: hypothetical protein C0597_12675 [Marinilabiliales bacterium]
MIHMKKGIGIYLILLTIASCKPTSETRTTKIEHANLNAESGIVYALPRTNITFEVEASKTEIFPGPYYEYAEKYMGLENVPNEKQIIWNIDDIKISTYYDLDPEEYYLIEPSGKLKIDFNKLFENGSILPVNKSIESNFPNAFYGKSSSENEIVYTDLSVTKYVGKEKVTYYKRVQRDSLFAKVPVTETKSVYKSFAEKAEEAANFIFTIREKRVELLTGMADFYPEGKALEVALEELNRLENDYLELFIGKRFTSHYSANFEFTPTDKELEQPYILFRFHDEKGLLSANDLSGRPIIIELEKKNQTRNLSYLMDDQVNREGMEYKNKLYYRVPDQVQVRVFDGNNLLARRKVHVEQYGEVLQFPAMFLMDEEKFIEFYRDED